MNFERPDVRVRAYLTHALAALFALSVFCLAGRAEAFGQKKFTRTFPANKNVKLQLRNVAGTVTVEGWERNEIKIVADLDTPVANLTPQLDNDTLIIDVKGQNRERADVGTVNFKIWAPNGATVDIETGQGNISVKDIYGSMVRAHVWLGGDIELLNIKTMNVMANNTTGDIIFDGILMGGGKYEFKSTQGNINIRIPADSAFSLDATSPGRSINLGAFAGGNFNLSDPRKAVGSVGANPNSFMNVANQKGRIVFFKR